VIKRCFDFAVALFGLIVLAPFLSLIALLVKFDSKGPVFFRQERIGRGFKPFKICKIRTMVENAAQSGELTTSSKDPRITRMGAFLRRTKIDELPQFINVLRQEMSVVGPRPPLRREVESYDLDVQRRLLVKPGVTGLWQVSGRSDLSWDKSVRLDLSYVDNWSMVGDVLIIAKTVRAVFQRKGAY
jgi:lipopolysaccharide/colanic/teichoic acid biosynthesis glycosyltransferase